MAQCEISGSGSCSTDADCRATISSPCPESDIKQAKCSNVRFLLAALFQLLQSLEDHSNA